MNATVFRLDGTGSIKMIVHISFITLVAPSRRRFAHPELKFKNGNCFTRAIKFEIAYSGQFMDGKRAEYRR